MLRDNSFVSIPLISKLISKEISLGQHDSLRAGAGIEFEQYRNYQIGDDIKTVDWKKYMQSGKLISRQSTADRRLQINVFLDVSASMAYVENDKSRFMYAKTIAATFAHAVYQQGDKMDFLLFHEDTFNQNVIQNNSLNTSLIAIEKANISKDKLMLALKNIFFASQIIVVISDFLGNTHTIVEKIKQWANTGNEIYAFQILGESERTFDFKTNQTFIGLEDDSEWPSDTKAMRKSYLENLQKHQTDLKANFQHKNIRFGEFSLADDLHMTLPAFFKNQPWHS